MRLPISALMRSTIHRRRSSGTACCLRNQRRHGNPQPARHFRFFSDVVWR
jgi:hypothetical protein